MRVAFDDQIFTSRPLGGIGRYFAELIKELASTDSFGLEVQLDARWSISPQMKELGLSKTLEIPLLGERVPVMRAANRLRRSPATDISHSTFFEPAYLMRAGRGKRVVTVYDMIPELMPELFPDGNPHLAKREFVEAADHVICISQATADDLLAIYGKVEATVEVIHLGVGEPFVHGLAPLETLPERYFLFVGQRGGYKDFEVAFAAFERIADELPHSLVVVGGGNFDADELAAQHAAGLEGRVIQLALGDDQLARAYGGAECFVFPSRYEGFGLPTLEAMACGTPALLARSSSHPEAGGAAARYFEPGDVDGLAAQLLEIAEDHELRAHLTERSLAHAATMTWRNTANAHAAAYHRLCES